MRMLGGESIALRETIVYLVSVVIDRCGFVCEFGFPIADGSVESHADQT